MIGDRRAFILKHTALERPPHTPELELHLASEIEPIWRQTEEELKQQGLEPPFWAFAWAGGQALARYLLDHPETVAGRRVVDVASGSGLVAIAAASAGAEDVTAYDIDPLAAAAITANADANGVAVTAVTADILDEPDPPPADVLLAADAFYQRELAGRVMRFLERGRAHGAGVLVGDFGRTYLPRDRLTPLACYDVPGLDALEDSDIKRTTVWAPAGRAAGVGGARDRMRPAPRACGMVRSAECP